MVRRKKIEIVVNYYSFRRIFVGAKSRSIRYMSDSDFNQDGKINATHVNGIVLHILIQKQERCGEMKNGIEVDEFKEICSASIRNCGGIISNISTNAIMGIFAGDDAETKAADCVSRLRDLLYCKRSDNGWHIIMKACINGGEIIIGSSLGNDEYEVMGSAVSASFQILDTTNIMQISLTRHVRDKLVDRYHFVPRRPTDIGLKPVLLFYLHTPADMPCALSENA